MNLKQRLIAGLRAIPKVRKLRAIWAPEEEQELQAVFDIRSAALLRRYAATRINRRLYKKVIIRGNTRRVTRAPAGHGKRRRNGVS